MSERHIIDCETGEERREPLSAEEEAQREADGAQYVEQTWGELRAERDRRLALCDWTQVALDAPLSDEQRAAWASYRQELRDLPAATSDPREPQWPEPPPGLSDVPAPVESSTP
ncbi:MAG TPA: tail fiber assembly protein [Solirubrobacteraceae bacterium]|jgi:hypothetical protein